MKNQPWAAVVARDEKAIQDQFRGTDLTDTYPYDGGVVGLLQPGESFPVLPEALGAEGISTIIVGENESIVRSLAKDLAERTDLH